jgi:hypothetical protein
VPTFAGLAFKSRRDYAAPAKAIARLRKEAAMRNLFWTLLVGVGCMCCAVAEPTGGMWIDPPGWIGQCFVCPDNVTSDCMDAEPVYIEIDRDHHHRMCHVTQVYPVAWSEETGLRYHGTLTMTIQFLKPDEAKGVLSCHWLREDGMGVLIIQQFRLRYLTVNDRPEIQILRQRNIFTCH